LLRILSTTSAIIECTLEIASLNDEIEFNALSYCWGSERDAIDIVVNGGRVSVTQNLAAALNHLRSTQDVAVVPIWADAICINQSDVLERNAQVAMMSQLYKLAKLVHIWLGDSNLVQVASMQALQELSASILQDPNSGWTRHYDSSKLQLIENLAELSGIPYWRRTWILQEIALKDRIVLHGAGKRVEFACPSSSSYGSVWTFIYNAQEHILAATGDEIERRIRQVGISSRELFEPMAMAQLMKQGDRWAESDQMSMKRILIDVLFSFRDFCCRDPRDKIYGLLGLLPSTINIIPDYNKSAETVFAEATLRLIMHSNNLEILGQACSHNRNLPSWVPDFAVPFRVYHKLIKWNTKYRADGAVRPEVPIEVQTTDLRSLTVKGFILDRVVQVADGLVEIPGCDMPTQVLRTLQRWQALYLAHFPSNDCDTSNSMTESPVFWRWAYDGLSGRGHLLQDANKFDYYFKLPQLLKRALIPEDRVDEVILDYLRKITAWYDYIVTANGLSGLAFTSDADAGDFILVMSGAPTPFCARMVSSSPHTTFSLRGACFVENQILDGERSEKNVMFGAAVHARQAVFESDRLNGEEVFYDLRII
jgi:hypothetical protein